jgi:hypothetical protein
VSAARPPGGVECPSCGAPTGPGQEYCLECGHRIGSVPRGLSALSAAWGNRFGWYPGAWVWPVLLALVLAAAGAVAAIVLSDAGAGNGPLVATEGGPAHLPTAVAQTATVVLPSVPAGTPEGPPPTPTAPPPATKAPGAPAAPAGLTSWPAGRSGYTVVLVSIPTSAGRALAVARAQAAARAGLPQVGVLDSGKYSNLHAGYYVVFSGFYPTSAEATQARSAAAAKGFRAAYMRQITR